MNRRLLLPCTAFLILLLTACGGGTPTPTGPLALSQTFTSDDGRLTIQFPEGWEFADSQTETLYTTVLFANTRAALVLPPQTGVGAGQLRGTITVRPFAALAAIRPELGTEANPRAILDALFAPVIEASPGLVIENQTDTTVAGQPAATADVRIDVPSQTVVQLYTVADLGGGNILTAQFDLRIDEREQHEPTLRAMLDTVRYGG